MAVDEMGTGGRLGQGIEAYAVLCDAKNEDGAGTGKPEPMGGGIAAPSRKHAHDQLDEQNRRGAIRAGGPKKSH